MSYYDELVRRYVEERNRQAKETTTRANNQKRAARTAYTSEMTRMGATNAEQQQREKQGYEELLEELLRGHQNSVAEVEQGTNDALHDAYLSMRLDERDLPQALSANNIAGGMAETLVAGLRSNYGNNRTELMRSRMKALVELESLLNGNRLTLGRERDGKLNALQNAYQAAMQQRTANKNVQMADIDKQKGTLRANIDASMSKQISAVRLAQAKAQLQRELQAARTQAERELSEQRAALAAQKKR